MKASLDTSQEENEFLADSVEQYKKLFRDEKEKCNDLEDRLFEESQNLAHAEKVCQELDNYKHRVTALQEQLEQKEKEFLDIHAQLEQKDNDLLEAHTQLEQKEKELLDIHTQLEQKEKELLDIHKKLELKDEELKDTHAQLELNDNERLEAHTQLEQKEKKLLDTQIRLEQKDNELVDIHKQLEQREKEFCVRLEQKELEFCSQLQHQQNDIVESSEDTQTDKMDIPRPDDDSVDASTCSDSGLSAGDSVSSNPQPLPSPPIHKTVKTLVLSKPSKPTNEHPQSEPRPRPRWKKKLRQHSLETLSHSDLVLLVGTLQDREAALASQLNETLNLEETLHSSIASSNSQEANASLRNYNTLSGLQTSEVFTSTADASLRSYPPAGSVSRSLTTQTSSTQQLAPGKRLGPGLATSLPIHPPVKVTMLDKPEDVLHQRIQELEGLDKHNKTMVADLEKDRELLHEIARRDKALIHDLTVKLREMQLSERSLAEQVSSLEVSESSLFSKCQRLESEQAELEDRVHELEIHERRLRELVRKLKLDEERWLSRTGGFETAVAELSANEASLKRLVQDIEMEKGGLSERATYLEARVRELESVEAALTARINNFQVHEVSLQNRLVKLEKAEAAAQSRASELDALNLSLSHNHKTLAAQHSVATQHLAQLQGQVQELDRRLLSSKDSELAYKQHVDSLQKNESLLQKKVREFELREIDSQSALRQLEQTNGIHLDKIASLQRSENKLRYRVTELEQAGGKIPGELSASQQHTVSPSLELNQKTVLQLQAQVEALKLELRNSKAASPPGSQLTEEEEERSDSQSVSVSGEEMTRLQSQAAVAEELHRQNSALEEQTAHLQDTVLLLRHGKDACGHEVEIEVIKTRLQSYQAFFNKFKLALSSGQMDVLSDLNPGSVGANEPILPARHLHGLEAERILQSVQGLHAGDATVNHLSGVISPALIPQTESVRKAEASVTSSAPQAPDSSPQQESDFWQTIEARKAVTGAMGRDLRGGSSPGQGRKAKQLSSASEVEEVTLTMVSESEMSSHPVPPPRKHRSSHRDSFSGDDSFKGSDSDSHHQHHQEVSEVKVSQSRFPGQAALPLTAANLAQQSQSRPESSLSRVDSLYLPSSTQEGVDSLDDDDQNPPPLPAMGPPGQEVPCAWSDHTSASERGSGNDSTSRLSIRERIGLIEKQLQSDSQAGNAGQEEGDQLFYWKGKSAEHFQQKEKLERINAEMKDDPPPAMRRKEKITKLEKELEEKRRQINTLELWLSSLETLLKNKSKQTDREMVETLQQDLHKLRQDLTRTGYSPDHALLDPAALQTQLERRDREISGKDKEIQSLGRELRLCHKECQSIEGMRRNALDSLRALEKELLGLQDTETKLQQAHVQLDALTDKNNKMKEVYQENLALRDQINAGEVELTRLRNLCDDFNNLSARYDELEQFKNQALAMVQPLQMEVEKLTRQCHHKDVLLRRLGAEMKRELHGPFSALEELTRLERAMAVSGHCSDNSDSVDFSPKPVSSRRHRSMSLDELSHDPVSPKGHRHAPYARPRSADGPRPFPDTETSGSDFVAVADYDPALFSHSDHPNREMPLKAGDSVTVVGPPDRRGYCQAVCGGHAGLVPASYLQPVSSQSNGLPTDPAYRRLGHGHLPPEPPSHLRVRSDRKYGDGDLVLAWDPPPVTGDRPPLQRYRVKVGDQEMSVPDTDQCQVTLSSLDLSRPHLLSVQSVSPDGLLSESRQLVVGGSSPDKEATSSCPAVSVDLSSILQPNHSSQTPRKKVVAVYHYDPHKHSPSSDTSTELSFQPGDVMTVFGPPRADGFYHGQIGGRRGLIPACFVEDLNES